MATYKVVPTCLRTQNQAPAVLVEADEQTIEDVALTVSPLFDMPDSPKAKWVPSITKLKSNTRR